MLNKYHWNQKLFNPTVVQKLTEEAGIEPLLAKLFLTRGISDPVEIKNFINPSLSQLHDPFLMDGMDKVVDRISEARKNNEKVTVYSDYDVDGVVCATVLTDYLRHIGLEPELYIPTREGEGYGLSDQGVDTIRDWGSTLVITWHCGISAEKEVKVLMDAGIDVIVTDHHQCPKVLPDAYAILNPCKRECSYPYKELAGAGVVFKLIQALSQKLEEPKKFMDYLDLAALGTICDVVPLTGENRIIAKYGIERLNSTKRVGIRALIDESGISDKNLEAYHVGFMLGPRINAAGRLGSAMLAVELLSSNDKSEAATIAAKLGEENKKRQNLEKDIVDNALDKIERRGLQKDKVIVVEGEAWHQGVIGIVASRISNKFYKPCIVLSVDENEAKGSCRSIEGFNIFEALSECSELLKAHGGHAMAAGLSLEQGNINKLRIKLNKLAEKTDADIYQRRINVDGQLSESELNIRSAYLVKSMEPFGNGNPMPNFAARNVRVVECRKIGNGKHLKMKLSNGRTAVDAVAWNVPDAEPDMLKNRCIDALVNLDTNSWNGMTSLQLRICDIKFSS